MTTPSVLLGFLLLPLSLLSASPVVEEGFADFRARGAETALSTWSKNNPDPTLLQSQGKFAELIRQEKVLGPFIGHEIRSQTDLGSGSTLYLASTRFEKGTVFFRFLVFTDSLNRSSVTVLRWSSDPFLVWPEKALFPDKRT